MFCSNSNVSRWPSHLLCIVEILQAGKSSVVTKEGLKQQVQDIEETDLKIGSNDVADVNVEETYVNIGCNKVVYPSIDWAKVDTKNSLLLAVKRVVASVNNKEKDK